jgi:hypothetical protein
MSLAFVDDRDALVLHTVPAASATASQAVVSLRLIDAGEPAGGKAALLRSLVTALALPDSVDNLDALYDALTDSTGAIAVVNAAAWWRAEPLLLARVSQCFVDVGDRVALTWVMAD